MTLPEKSRLEAAVERPSLIDLSCAALKHLPPPDPPIDGVRREAIVMMAEGARDAEDFARAILDHYAPRLADARRIIEEIEWSESEELENGMIQLMICPFCNSSSIKGHAPDCEIAKFLEETKDEVPEKAGGD